MSTPVFHAPAMAVPGLRTVLIGRTRQVLGTQLNQLAAATLVVFGIGGVAFEALRLVEQDGVLGTQWQTLGALYVVLAFAVFFLQPTRPGPHRVNGSAARALVSTGSYRRWLVREAHIPALFTARGYVFRVVALIVVWLGGGFIYVNLLRGWLDGAGTVLPAAWVVLGALGVGVLSTLLLIPGRHQARTRIDEEGQFVPLPEAGTAGDPAWQSSPVPVLQAASVAAGSSPQSVPDQPGAQSHAAPARVDQPPDAAPVGQPAAATPTPPPTPDQPAFGGREGGRGAGRTVLAVLLAVLLTIAVGVAIVGYLAVGRGEARSRTSSVTSWPGSTSPAWSTTRSSTSGSPRPWVAAATTASSSPSPPTGAAPPRTTGSRTCAEAVKASPTRCAKASTSWARTGSSTCTSSRSPRA